MREASWVVVNSFSFRLSGKPGISLSIPPCRVRCPGIVQVMFCVSSGEPVADSPAVITTGHCCLPDSTSLSWSHPPSAGEVGRPISAPRGMCGVRVWLGKALGRVEPLTTCPGAHAHSAPPSPGPPSSPFQKERADASQVQSYARELKRRNKPFSWRVFQGSLLGAECCSCKAAQVF